MGNPRQRRKTRSSAHKTVQHSRHAKRNLRKMKPIRGPQVLKDAWDNKKTLRQNYAAMGLVGSLKQADSGGSERPVQLTSEAAPTHSGMSAVAASGKLPRGFGKILRDTDGKVIGVEMADEDDEDGEDRELEDDTQATGQKTQVINALEKLAEASRPVSRHSSGGEVAVLRKLIAKHGHDLEAMSKDRQLNEWQRTPGQLQRACRKAGLQ